jgi:hypothetical protein
MDELISRQAAIERFDYIRPRDPMTSDYTHGIDVGIALCKVAIREQPPAQLGTNLAQLGTDCISRQAAIDICANAIDLWRGQLGEGALIAVRDKIKELPPAQPEVVRCKDCKHWIPYDWMFSEVWQSQSINDYPEDEMGCKWCDMSMKANDFCSRADMREVTT